MNTDFWTSPMAWGVIVPLAILADIFLMRKIAARRRQNINSTEVSGTVYVLHRPSVLLSWLRKAGLGIVHSLPVRWIMMLVRVTGKAISWIITKFSILTRKRIVLPGLITHNEPVPLRKSPETRINLTMKIQTLTSFHSAIPLKLTRLISKDSSLYIEIGMILAWALWIGKNYIKLQPEHDHDRRRLSPSGL